MESTDPWLYVPIGLMVSLTVVGAFVFLIGPWRLAPWWWPLIAIWVTATIAFIPAATAWVLASEAYTDWPTSPLGAAIVLFIGGVIYREMTWVVWFVVTKWIPAATVTILRGGVWAFRRWQMRRKRIALIGLSGNGR